MDVINIGTLAEVVIALPPLKEQKLITEFLGCQIAKIDTLVAVAEQAISLLKERRTALISAAVTGKIDVRGLVEQDRAA